MASARDRAKNGTDSVWEMDSLNFGSMTFLNLVYKAVLNILLCGLRGAHMVKCFNFVMSHDERRMRMQVLYRSEQRANMKTIRPSWVGNVCCPFFLYAVAPRT